MSPPHARPRPISDAARAAAEERISHLQHGEGAIGRLGELAVWWSGVRGVLTPPQRPRLVVFAADHGLRNAGVTGRGPDDGPRLAAELAAGRAAAALVAKRLGVEVEVVDVGLCGERIPGIRDRRVRDGTGDLRLESAMSRAEAEAAILAGQAVAREATAAGVDLLVAGELGVGGSTAAAAVLSALAATPGKLTAGRGKGLDDRRVGQKVRIIDEALARTRPDRHDAIGVLAAVGGLELGAICGLCLEAAAAGVPVLLDGLGSTAGGLLASTLEPGVGAYLWIPQQSSENAHWAACRLLGQEPPTELKIVQGDGLGALLGVPLLRAATALLGSE